MKARQQTEPPPLDPRLVRLIRALARKAAREDHAAAEAAKQSSTCSG